MDCQKGDIRYLCVVTGGVSSSCMCQEKKILSLARKLVKVEEMVPFVADVSRNYSQMLGNWCGNPCTCSLGVSVTKFYLALPWLLCFLHFGALFSGPQCLTLLIFLKHHKTSFN
jgi:hypothetical protein